MTALPSLRLLPIVLLLGAALACGRADTPSAGQTNSVQPAASERALTKVIFQAGFKPQANLPFVAAYVAKDKGWFAQEGLDVEIQHSSGQDAHLLLLANNKIQFATAVASTILKQQATSSPPLQSIALFGQRGDTVLMVLNDSPIRSPKDFEGKTVGYKVLPAPEYLAMLRAAGVDRSKVTEVGVGFDPRILIERKVDVLPVFRSNEPDLVRSLGQEVRIFDPADFGVSTLGVTYVTNSEWAEKNPQLVTSFLRATLRAVAWIENNRDEAIDITLRYAPQEQRAHQRYMLDVELEAAKSDLTAKNGIGWMTEQQWQTMQDVLVEYKGIAKPVDVKKAFTMKYLEPLYREGKLLTPP